MSTFAESVAKQQPDIITEPSPTTNGQHVDLAQAEIGGAARRDLFPPENTPEAAKFWGEENWK